MNTDNMKQKDFSGKRTTDLASKDESDRLSKLIFDSLEKQAKYARLVALMFVILSATSFPIGVEPFSYLQSAGFLIGAFYLYFKSKTLPDSLRNAPLQTLIDTAEDKLSYMKRSELLVTIPILMLICTGSGAQLISRLTKYTDNLTLLIVCWIILFTCLCLFGHILGKKNWEKEYGTLYEEIRSKKSTLCES